MLQMLLSAADRRREPILSAERTLWKMPETGFREQKTSAWLAEQYRALGYVLTLPGDIPGFTAELDTGRPGPTVCVLGELDSLVCRDHPDADPSTGAVHACGHHAQSAALLGVAAALREPGAVDDLCGKIRLVAVPAEELIELEYRQSLYAQGTIRYLGGKVEFLRRGLLDGVDLAFMIHTGGEKNKFTVDRGGNGCLLKNVAFQGVATHASCPFNAVNALYAANLALNAINALRETFDDVDHIRVHPIMTSGGTVVNAIPADVRLESYVRGAGMEAIARANRRVNRAIAGAALSMGAQVRVHDTPGYSPLINDLTLRRLAAEAFGDVVGSERVVESEGWSYGCTDMGDLSSVLPVIQPYVGGCAGIGHGNDYRIDDPEMACVTCAKGQLSLIDRLLRDDARAAREVVACHTPLYPTFEMFFAALESLRMDRELVEYAEDTAAVRL